MTAKSVTQYIIEYLEIRIISGQLIPGQKLNENDLCSLMDVSTAPLREAFRVLQSKSLILTIPRKGCFVTEVSIEDCRKIYKVRELIELAAIDLIEEHNTRILKNSSSAPHLFSVQQNTLQDNQTQKIGDFIELMDFHLKLVESSGNDWLVKLYMSIAPTLSRYQFFCYSPKIDAKGSEDHKLIMKSIKKGNYDRGKKLLTNHLRFFFNQVENSFSKDKT